VRFHSVFAPNHVWRPLVAPVCRAALANPARGVRPRQRSFSSTPSELRAFVAVHWPDEQVRLDARTLRVLPEGAEDGARPRQGARGGRRLRLSDDAAGRRL
jgi:hypothetical protein